MKITNRDEEMITRYLLGKLSEVQQSQFEERYFAEPELYRAIRVRERDMIDRYAQDDVADSQLERFVGKLRPVVWRKKVALARSFYGYLADMTKKAERPHLPLSTPTILEVSTVTPGSLLVVAILLIVFSVSLLISKTIVHHPRLEKGVPQMADNGPILEWRLAEASDQQQLPRPGVAASHQKGKRNPSTGGDNPGLHAPYLTDLPMVQTSMNVPVLPGNGTRTVSRLQPLAVIGPTGINILEDRPVIRWREYEGATVYRVYLFGPRIFITQATANVEWKMPHALRHGEVYEWYVEAFNQGRKIATSKEAKFNVVSDVRADEIRQCRKMYANSPIECLPAYLEAGLLDEIESELYYFSGPYR